jgi:hypothetical protein
MATHPLDYAKARPRGYVLSQLLSAEASISDDACPSARLPNFDLSMSISTQANLRSINNKTASN